MTFAEIDRLARLRAGVMPEHCQLYELQCYHVLRSINREYRSGQLTEDAARHERAIAEQALLSQQFAEQEAQRLYVQVLSNRERASSIREDLLHGADALSTDDMLRDRQLRKAL